MTRTQEFIEKNKKGKLVIPYQWIYVYGFNEGLSVIVDFNYKHGYIDKTGNIVIIRLVLEKVWLK